jgi:hypothetical protein
MKVLFLDVDGVLNYRGVFKPGNPMPICPKAWAMLRQVIEKTGCKIVLSSTWRLGDRDICPYIGKLRSFGLFDYTHEDWRTKDVWRDDWSGSSEDMRRGTEIAEWLSRHPEVKRYAIVDDDSDMLDDQRPFFVKTSFDSGLMREHRDRLIELLISPAT